MAAAKKPSTAKPARKKLADVAKPGTTAPAASAKPIIVTNRPLLQDPMMVGSDAPVSPEAPAGEPAAAPPSAAKLTIRPITVLSPEDDDKKPVDVKIPEAEVTERGTAPVETPATAENAAVVDAAPQPDESKAPEPAEPPAATATEDAAPAADAAQPDDAASAPAEDVAAKGEDKDAAEADQKSDDVPASAQTPEQIDAAAQEAEKQAAEHAAAIEKLAESKQYYLPIATAEQRQAKRFIALGIVLIVLLGLAWLDIALDAGLVHLQGVQPLTHFFAH